MKLDADKYRVTKEGLVYIRPVVKIPLVGKGKQHTGEYKIIEKPERQVVARVNNRGYLACHIGKKTKMIHRIVAEAFLPNPDNKPFINHKDGNKLNNNVNNLEWCTHKENMRHAFKTGLISEEGRKNSIKAIVDAGKRQMLPIEDVRYIRKVFKKRHKKYGNAPLAKRFGISVVTLSYIVNYRKAYKDVK